MKREEILSSRQLAGRVKRFHTWPVLHQQTVGEHSARVATIYVEVFGLPRAEVLYYCLHHDSGHMTSGDSPFPVKTTLPGMKHACDAAEKMGLDALGVELPKLSKLEKRRVKICDLLEMYEFGVVELNMGNIYAIPIVRDTRETALEMARFEILPLENEFRLVRHWLATTGA